ncbi:MAG: hypothetical protein IAE79_06470 [Anaerolinea sp.]|nr:hypothetical protein [Anaerolinea sp.]
MYDPYSRQPEGRGHRLLFSLLVGGLIFLSFWLRVKYPAVMTWLPGMLWALGLPIAITPMFLVGRYKNIFDHEPTTFRGKPTTGKEIRILLSRTMNIGWGLLIIGIIFFLLS